MLLDEVVKRNTGPVSKVPALERYWSEMREVDYEIKDFPVAAIKNVISRGIIRGKVNEFSGAVVSARGNPHLSNPPQNDRTLYLHIQAPDHHSILREFPYRASIYLLRSSGTTAADIRCKKYNLTAEANRSRLSKDFKGSGREFHKRQADTTNDLLKTVVLWWGIRNVDEPVRVFLTPSSIAMNSKSSRERDSQLRRPLALSLNNRSLLPSGILLDRLCGQSLCSDRVEWTVEVSVRGLGLGIIVREPFGTISKLLVLDRGNLVADPRLLFLWKVPPSGRDDTRHRVQDTYSFRDICQKVPSQVQHHSVRTSTILNHKRVLKDLTEDDCPTLFTTWGVVGIEEGCICSTVIVVPASRFFSKLQNGGALPMPLPVLPDTSATDELTRRFSSFADCEWNCCVYIVKLVFDILGRCVVCTRNGLRKETIYVCETCTARPNLHPDTCFKTYHTLTLS
ncbi:hypothetical protein J6590_059600 [Homalodisca vitripennis]|nr:hypothetical protein J6590_059600 [Homalodisca vitripennis]